MTPRILIVDDAESLVQLYAAEVTRRLGHLVQVVHRLDGVESALAEHGPFDLALVDLSFPKERGTGLDALVVIHRAHPNTKLAVLTQGDDWVAEPLRDAWELLPLVTVMSKSAPIDVQLDTIHQALTSGRVAPDPIIQPLLPAGRSGRRSRTDFGRLVHHQGHAKLWTALQQADDDVSYRSIARDTGLKLNTIKNYRTQLLPELAEHGLADASLREMRDFAVRCRAFLLPHLRGEDPSDGAAEVAP